MKKALLGFLACGLMLQAMAIAKADIKVLIAYRSKSETQNTKQLAEAVAAGASQSGVTVSLKQVSDITNEEVRDADAIIIGSPVWNANIHPEVMTFINNWPFDKKAQMWSKVGAAFVTSGGISAGEEMAQMNILKSMMIFGMVVVGGPHWSQAFGASAIVNEFPFQKNFKKSGKIDKYFIEKGKTLGRRVVEVTKKLNADK